MFQYVTEEEQRNSSIKNEEAGLKQEICSVVDVSGGESLMLYRTILGRNLEC